MKYWLLIVGLALCALSSPARGYQHTAPNTGRAVSAIASATEMPVIYMTTERPDIYMT